MALIKCSECEKEISDQAVTCPHCGAPVVIKEKVVSPSQKALEEKKKLEQEEIERIAKLPPRQRLTAEKKRKERLENEEKNNTITGVIGLGVILILIISMFRSCGGNEKTPYEVVQKQQEKIEQQQIDAISWYIKKNMKNPDSFEFVSSQRGYDSNAHKDILTITYRGTNGFNAIMTEEKTAYIESNGDVGSLRP